jgi:hypothetical protein
MDKGTHSAAIGYRSLDEHKGSTMLYNELQMLQIQMLQIQMLQIQMLQIQMLQKSGI